MEGNLGPQCHGWLADYVAARDIFVRYCNLSKRQLHSESQAVFGCVFASVTFLLTMGSFFTAI